MLNSKHQTIQTSLAKIFITLKIPTSFAVTAQLISAFVFATRIVQFLFLNPKFQAFSSLLLLHRFVFDLVGNPEAQFFSRKLALPMQYTENFEVVKT